MSVLDRGVMADLIMERMASLEEHGPQRDMPDGVWPDESTHWFRVMAQRACEQAAEREECTWNLVVGEEWAEVLDAADEDARYREVIQLMNVVGLWAEAMRARRRERLGVRPFMPGGETEMEQSDG